MNLHLPRLALTLVGLIACGGADTDTEVPGETDTEDAVPYAYTSPEACPGAARIRADPPQGFYNTIPRSFVNFEGRLWMSAMSVEREDTTHQPALWAPLDCSGEDAPVWRRVGTGGGNQAYLFTGHDRLLLGTIADGTTRAQYLDADAEPLGDPVTVSAPAAWVGSWGLTRDGFFLPKDWTDEQLDVLLLDLDLEPSGLLSFEDVPRDGNAAAFGPPGQPGIAVVDEENGRLVRQRLDAVRTEERLALGRVAIMPSDPNSAFFVRYEVAGRRNVLTDGEHEHELDLPPGSYGVTIAAEGEGFWVVSMGNVYWLETWDAELELVANIDGDPELADYRASRVVGVGGDRVAVLFTNWEGDITSTVRIFER